MFLGAILNGSSEGFSIYHKNILGSVSTTTFWQALTVPSWAARNISLYGFNYTVYSLNSNLQMHDASKSNFKFEFAFTTNLNFKIVFFVNANLMLILKKFKSD